MSEHPETSRQTEALLQELADSGFTAGDRPSHCRPADGWVRHAGLGIGVHADADAIRIIISERDDKPAYRVLVPKYAVGDHAAVRLGAGLVRLIAADIQRRED